MADQNFATTKSIGIFNYSLHLAQALASQTELSCFTFLSNPSLNSLVKLPARTDIQNHPEAVQSKIKRILWDQWGVYKAAKKTANQWLFLPKGFASFCLKPPCSLALIAHDAMMDHYRRHYPQSYPKGESLYFGRCLRSSYRHASVIFTNSHFTKTEISRLCQELGIRPPNICVAGIGFDKLPKLDVLKLDHIVVLASNGLTREPIWHWIISINGSGCVISKAAWIGWAKSQKTCIFLKTRIGFFTPGKIRNNFANSFPKPVRLFISPNMKALECRLWKLF